MNGSSRGGRVTETKILEFTSAAAAAASSWYSASEAPSPTQEAFVRQRNLLLFKNIKASSSYRSEE